jgi:ribonuclease HIII
MDKKDSDKKLECMGKLIREEEEKMMALAKASIARENKAWQEMKDTLSRVGVKPPKGKK